MRHFDVITRHTAGGHLIYELTGSPRTSKTLMTRSGVSDFIADRVLGHVIPGVQDVYDRYDYLRVKREALTILGAR